MKIGFVTASLSRKAGGMHESVRRLAQSMSGSASYVHAFGLEDEYTAADRWAWEPIPVTAFRVRGPSRFGYAPAMSRTLLRSGVKLVMSHGLWMYPSIATAQWHSRTGGPYIVHPHGMLDPWAVQNSGFRKRLAAQTYERRHLENASCIRVLCESEANAIRAYGLRNPIAIVPNGVDLPHLYKASAPLAASAERRQLTHYFQPSGSDGFPEQTNLKASSSTESPLQAFKAQGRKVLLCLGRIHPKKGLINLLKAWARLRHSFLDSSCSALDQWLLAIAGWDEGGHQAELKQLATEIHIPWSDLRAQSSTRFTSRTLRSQLAFLGPQFGPDKAACYRDCDAFILPSFSEGLPMVVLEAWAHAKPVLMTPACNLPEGFAAGAAIRIGTDPESISRGLDELLRLQDRSLCELGTCGRALVAERFSWPNAAADMKAVYEWVLGSGNQPACVTLKA